MKASLISSCLLLATLSALGPTSVDATDTRAGTADYYSSITTLNQSMRSGKLTSLGLVQEFLDRIDRIDKGGPRVNSVLELNPDALEIARQQDSEGYTSGKEGLLHGVPVLIKGNIDTGDKMLTTAGSLAMLGAPAPVDATVVAKLRKAGAVLLGKTNLSEWANYRSTHSVSGWSGQGGLTRNPYVLDRSACGSSSGSGVAVAAGLVTVALGTETNGSVICPSAVNGIVGIKPTVGLVSRAGIIPISSTQDTAGVMARNVRDAAIVLTAIAGGDKRDTATVDADAHAQDYTKVLNGNALRGKRIGVVNTPQNISPAVKDSFERAVAVLRAQGASVVPAELGDMRKYSDAEQTVLSYQFKHTVNAYLGTRKGLAVHSLSDLIAWNKAHADLEMPWFGQEEFIAAEARGPLSDESYTKALEKLQGVPEEINEVMQRNKLDALVAPATGPSWRIDLVDGDHVSYSGYGAAAEAGFPSITVPSGFIHDLPVGIVFFGRKWSESTLIGIAYGFEQATQSRRNPKFLQTVGGPSNRTPYDQRLLRPGDLGRL